MSSYKKHILFFIIFFLFTVIVAGVKLYWIQKALPSRATVLYIDQTRFIIPKQFYPVVSYETLEGNVVTRGTYNLPVIAGETVEILYNPDAVREFRLNTTFWLWYDIWSWYRLILVLIAMYYIVLYIVQRSWRRTKQHLFENKGDIEPTSGFDDSTITPNSIESVADVYVRTPRRMNRLPRIVKAGLLLLVPVSVS
jgi:hypothetical protein